jgi:hypothetical protein
MDTQAPRLNYTVLIVRQVDYSRPWAKCDRCAAVAERVWDTERVAIDIDLDRPVLLLVRVSVHHCPACNHFFRAQPPFLRPDATYTNRVVVKAVQSVNLDGMAMTRVSERLGRDFWAQPSEGSVRIWCRGYAAGLDLATDYRQWVVEEFSGVLCVDEVYQGGLALLLAVDPAGPEGDRLVGFQLVRGHVEQRQVEEFLLGLREAGIMPEEVVTDGSSLYPTVLAKVWPAAVHQLCLFHETRAVTQSVLEVVREVRRGLPRLPRGSRKPGRPSKYERRQRTAGEEQPVPYDRPARVAAVKKLRQEGHSLRGIVRLTGYSRNTVRRWLREKPPEATAEGPASTEAKEDEADSEPHPYQRLDPAALASSEDATDEVGVENGRWAGEGGSRAPPQPWCSWGEVGQFAQTLTAQRFLLVHRQEHLRAEEKEKLANLLGHPSAAKLRTARDFLLEWYGLLRDERGEKRSLDEAWGRYRHWQQERSYRELGPLQRILAKVDEPRFTKLTHFLREPHWEATSNGAERLARAFRHLQAPHFALRCGQAIEDAIKVRVLATRARCTPERSREPARCPRGRKKRTRRGDLPSQVVRAA